MSAQLRRRDVDEAGLISDSSLGTILDVEDRFDEFMVELRREHDATLAVMREERAEWSARQDRRDAEMADLMRFLGELNRRGEIALQDLLRATAAMRADIRESIKETRASTAQTKANTETTKAHTRAIFALIDRLEGGSGGLAPAS